MLQTRIQEKKTAILKKVQEEEEHQKYLDAYWQQVQICDVKTNFLPHQNTRCSFLCVLFHFRTVKQCHTEYKIIYIIFNFVTIQIISEALLMD